MDLPSTAVVVEMSEGSVNVPVIGSAPGGTPGGGGVSVLQPQQVVAVGAVDGTATVFHLVAPSSGAVAVDPVPAGWVDSSGAVPVAYLPVGGVVVVPGDGAVGAPPGVYTVTASGAWTAHPLVAGQLLSVSPSLVGGPGSDPGFVLRASNRTSSLDPVDRIDTVLGASTMDRIDGVDTRIDGVDIVTQRDAFAAELATGITRVFRFDGHTEARWTTPTRTSSFTVGISARCLRMPTRQAPPGFAEWFTQAHDSGVGSWDNFEAADVWTDATFYDTGVPSAGQASSGGVRGFWEQTESGGGGDGSSWFPDLHLAPDQWTETMVTVDFASHTGRMWLRVPYDLGDGGTYHTDPDGALFRLVSTMVDAKFASIDAWAEDWWMGCRYSGDIARLEVRDGIGGTLIACPDASIVAAGAASFVDASGVTWTADAHAEVVDVDAVDAADIASGTVGTARLGSGTADTTTFLRGDQTWAAPSGASSDWHTISDEVLASDGSFAFPSLSGLTDIEIELRGRSTYSGAATDGVRMTLNGNTSADYSIHSGARTTSFNNNGSLPSSLTNTDRVGLWVAKFALGGVGMMTEGWVEYTYVTSTATTGVAYSAWSLHYWNTSAAITSFSLFFTSAANFAAGSRLTLRGRTAP